MTSFGNESSDPSMGVNDGSIRQLLYDWLLWNNPDGSLSPGVAKQWEMSTDGMTWTLMLRDELRFHNGASLTSADAKFSIERVLRSGSTAPFAAVWRTNVAALETTSPTVLTIKAKQPWPLMPYSASAREGTEGAVVNKAYFDQVGETKFREEPNGTGPWKLTSHDAGVRYRYESTQQNHPFRVTPSYKVLELIIAPEESTRVAMLKTNQVDMIDVGPDSVQDLRANRFSIFTIDAVATGQLLYFGWGDTRAASLPMNKREARKALSISINRQEIIETVLGGLAAIPTKSSIVVPGVLGYDPSWTPEPYDPAQAKALLTNAGYPNGFSLKIYSYPIGGTPWLPRAIEAIAGYWSNIGVKAEIVNSDFGTVAAAYRQRPQPDFLIGNLAAARQPPQSTGLSSIGAYYTSKGVLLNLVTAGIEALVNEANTTLSEARRVQVIRGIVNLAHDEWVSYPIATTGSLYGVSRSIASWTPVRSAHLGMALETVKPAR